jgi:hypothetical protein
MSAGAASSSIAAAAGAAAREAIIASCRAWSVMSRRAWRCLLRRFFTRSDWSDMRFRLKKTADAGFFLAPSIVSVCVRAAGTYFF